MDAGRIAAPHLEPVDRRQRLLDREIGRDCPRTGIVTGQRRHLACGPQPIVAKRPQDVAQSDRLGAEPLEDDGVVSTRFEVGIDVVDIRVELVESTGDRRDELVMVRQRHHAGNTAKQKIRFRGPARDGDRIAERGDRGIQQLEHVVRTRHRSGGPTTDHSDDAAHGSPGYRCAGRRWLRHGGPAATEGVGRSALVPVSGLEIGVISDQLGETIAGRLRELVGRRLDHDTNQRFGTAGPDEDAPR